MVLMTTRVGELRCMREYDDVNSVDGSSTIVLCLLTRSTSPTLAVVIGVACSDFHWMLIGCCLVVGRSFDAPFSRICRENYTKTKLELGKLELRNYSTLKVEVRDLNPFQS